MKRRIVALSSVIVAAFLAGAAAGRGASRSTPRAALEAIVADYDSSTTHHDAAVAVRHFRPDVVVLSPQSREAAVGIEANREAWARFFARPKAEHQMRTREIVMAESGDLAYSRADWTANVQLPDSTMAPGGGEVVTIWRRDPKGGADAWTAAVVLAHRTH